VNYFKQGRGFTLIELLLVLALIGVLATIVLALSGGARNKGKDAAIKSEMLSLRNQAELYYNDNSNSYNNLFTGNNTWASANTRMQELLAAINNKTTVHTAGSATNAWAAQAQLTYNATQYLCVHSLDNRAIIGTTAMAAGATVCP